MKVALKLLKIAGFLLPNIWENQMCVWSVFPGSWGSSNR